ncbi:MAG: DUF4129 domain-containing protein [Chloroflexi bacterium]|nr:DUF4129 domain-containing protein [Chloroflexota bacterium]MBI3732307.1 DUF4129 domain-containing protein [Chloroflexota bacterium]
MTTATAWSQILNPRRELLMLSSAAMETCWAFAIFEIALHAGGAASHGVTIGLYFSLLLFAIYGSRAALNAALPMARQRWLTVTLALGTIVLAMRISIFSNYAPLDFGWLGRLPGAVGNLFIAASPESLLLIMGVYAWWRGMTLAQAALDFESVGFRFRLGVLLLALIALINTWVGRVDLSPLLFAFFFFGLMAVALARQEDLSGAGTSVSLPLKGPWLGILAGSALLVLGVGLALAALLTPQSVRAMFNLLQPLEPILTVLLYLVLVVMSVIVEMIYNLISYLLVTFGSRKQNLPPLQLAPPPPFLQDQDANQFSDLLAAYWDPIRIVCAVMLFVGVLLLLAFSLNRMQRRNRPGGNETRESVPVAIKFDPLGRLRRLFARNPGEAMDDSIASIRKIYANLTRLAAQRGFPRGEAETPYEYVSDLRSAIPAAENEERLITEAYVRVHYGEHNPSDEEVAQIRQAWEHVKHWSESK